MNRRHRKDSRRINAKEYRKLILIPHTRFFVVLWNVQGRPEEEFFSRMLAEFFYRRLYSRVFEPV